MRTRVPPVPVVEEISMADWLPLAVVPATVKAEPEVIVTMPPRLEEEVEESPWVMVVFPPEVRVVEAALPDVVLAVMLLIVSVENSEVNEMEPAPVEELTDNKSVKIA